MHSRGIILALAAALALTVLWLVSPGATAVAILLMVLVAGLAVLGVRFRGGRMRASPSERVAEIHAALRTTLGDIPSEQLAHTPMLLVTGDGLAAIFEHVGNDHRVHHGGGAIWLRVDDPADLPQVAIAAKRWRNGNPPQGVVISVAPGLHASLDSLEGMLRSVRQALADAARRMGVGLSGHVAVYQRLSHGAASVSPEWFGIVSGDALIGPRQCERVVVSAEQAAQRSGGQSAAVSRAAALASIVPWSMRTVLGSLAGADMPVAPVRVQGVAWIDCGPAADWQHPWAHGVALRTGVRPADVMASPQPWPLPYAFLAAIHCRSPWSALSRTVAHALALFACAGAFAFWAAGKHNESLLVRVQGHLARYAAVKPGHDAAKRDALQALVSDRDELDRYARLGVPLRLSFGLYRGAHLMTTLEQAIASYVLPLAPPSTPPLTPPSVITLDGMAIFDSGRATLKAGSTKRMVDAVEMIKAHTDKRVLIAGHTDNVGAPGANLALSKARAEAVRDWLAEAADIAPARFAIQGYGDTRPVASNDSDAGRARNRRVEITLVPEIGN
ncbi:OmpA family protein [Pandoraea sp. NPDC087047]|uniref:OmpA family protein n=1 Tax=Pandoraea sp. NPDC087047 TaxID=3364390 RepID=UPI003807CEB6